MDDILLIGSNETSIYTTKAYRQMHFVMRVFQKLQFFFGIEFSNPSTKLVSSQRKYAFKRKSYFDINYLHHPLRHNPNYGTLTHLCQQLPMSIGGANLSNNYLP